MPGTKAPEEERRAQIIAAAFDVAARRGLEGLTTRLVAERAHLSAGLVLFHFKTREHLLVALLDWLLSTTTELHVTDDIAGLPSPLERLLALLEREMHRLSSEPRRIRLFFEYWLLGTRHPEIRRKMRAELGRYREAFRPMADEILRVEPGRFGSVQPAGIAGLAVSFIKGCAIQSIIDPRFDIDEYLAAAHSLLGQLASSPA
ncbi:MAG TPA: TetR/AcrR family transcriptional regulator [Gemmatimonadaceae bacterium]|jgi:AcrR family transcriptional regulator|nr:TetR/AcrR family transcriptional regulator [Gemmatimonadaceae bacterium]